MGSYTSKEIDRRLALLAQSERRAIIRYLRESEADTVPVGEIARHLRKSDATRDGRDEIAIELHHNHLPSLAAASVLDFDSSSEAVRYNGDELVEALLESIPESHTAVG